MFGYIVPSYAHLPPSALASYRMYYCEMCHHLRHGFGLISTLALNYDMTFNAIVMDSLAGSAEVYPSKASFCVFRGPYTDSRIFGPMAAYTMLLAKWELVDDETDKPSMKSRLASAALGRAVAKAERLFPECDEAIGRGFGELRKLELEECTDPLFMGRTFGSFLSCALTDMAADTVPGLNDMFTDLAAIVYLMDTVDDLEEDYMNGTYNPFLAECGRFVNKKTFIADNTYMITEKLKEAAGNLRRSYSAVRGSMGCGTGVADNIIYRGIPGSAKSVLNCSCLKPSAANMIISRMKRSY